MNISLEDKKKEAASRLKNLNFEDEIVERFVSENVIPVCFSSIDNIFPCEKNPKSEIVAFERKFDALVYCIIITETSFGVMASYLFVSDYLEEWENDNNDIKDNYAMTWTENLTHPSCSEFGSIAFEPTPAGGLRRVG